MVPVSLDAQAQIRSGGVGEIPDLEDLWNAEIAQIRRLWQRRWDLVEIVIPHLLVYLVKLLCKFDIIKNPFFMDLQSNVFLIIP